MVCKCTDLPNISVLMSGQKDKTCLGCLEVITNRLKSQNTYVGYHPMTNTGSDEVRISCTNYKQIY